MSSVARPPPANTKGPNPTSSAYAAQRGSVDMLMKAKPASVNTRAVPTGIDRGPAANEKKAGTVKISFLEAVRAQRQEKAQMVRSRVGGQSSTITTTTITNPNAAGKVPKTGGFSALLASSRGAPATPKASAAAAATTTTSTATVISTSFAQVQDELEAGFQRYSRANPLGGVGTAMGGGTKGEEEANSKGHATTATSRNLKARQLMVAPMAKNERQQQQQQQQQQQKKQYNKGGDSSDEDAGRSALGRSKRARKG